MQMLRHELIECSGQEWPFARQQLLVNDRQTVLIGKSARTSVKDFWSGINRIAASPKAAFEDLQVGRLPEIADLNMIVNEEKISRFEIPVRNLLLSAH